MKKMMYIPMLIFAVIICELAGIVSSYFSKPSLDSWYQTLVQPDIAPPSWIFAPVWTALFALMGIALFFVWKSNADKASKKTAIQVFSAQLLLNIMWSILFFGLQSPRGALVEILSLWLIIVATMIAFFRISRTTMYLLIPYILWVSFAAYLNFSIWILNK
ncbi:MAG: TspO/MBR family protein [Candidatus Taylorbacteria bacterium]